jgi:hypothetical protein
VDRNSKYDPFEDYTYDLSMIGTLTMILENKGGKYE